MVSFSLFLGTCQLVGYVETLYRIRGSKGVSGDTLSNGILM